MKQYEGPTIKEEDIIIEDIVMISGHPLLGEIDDEDGEVFPGV